MSTSDVPGANPANGDDLAAGCWAEHSDGSLMVVQNTENDAVVYLLMDTTRDPPDVYIDRMPEGDFKRQYTRRGWTWHDKTPFPWQRVIRSTRPGRVDVPENSRTEAERIAQSRHLQRHSVDEDDIEHLLGAIRSSPAARDIITRLARAIGELPE
jgi:hypothetical protein